MHHVRPTRPFPVTRHLGVALVPPVLRDASDRGLLDIVQPAARVVEEEERQRVAVVCGQGVARLQTLVEQHATAEVWRVLGSDGCCWRCSAASRPTQHCERGDDAPVAFSLPACCVCAARAGDAQVVLAHSNALVEIDCVFKFRRLRKLARRAVWCCCVGRDVTRALLRCLVHL